MASHSKSPAQTSTVQHAIPATPASANLTIDLGALAENWRTLQAMSQGQGQNNSNRTTRQVETAAIVKADAYGCGLNAVAETLWDKGARTFFTATPEEGARLRAICPTAVIYILNGFAPDAGHFYEKHALCPVLGNRPELEEWLVYRNKRDRPLPAALHFDTGMNRLGFEERDHRDLVNHLAENGFMPALIMTHLACADTPAHPLNDLQWQRFATIRKAFPSTPASFLNSAGLLTRPERALSLTRPGIALYGGAAVYDLANPMKPVVQATTRVLQVRTVAAGETIGYGAHETAKTGKRIAILSIGYADGFLRSGSSSDQAPGGQVAFAGQRAPIIGRISMDLTAIDVSHLPAGMVERGTDAEIFGATISLEEAANAAGTIDYELLTALGQRYQRTYLSPDQ